MHDGECRRDRRRASQGTAKLTPEAREIEGLVEGLLQSGLLFSFEGGASIRVGIEENGTKEQRGWRLVRSQRMRGDGFGWAREFDAAKFSITQ